MSKNTTYRTYPVGDRVQTLPVDGCTPAGTLGTITDHRPPGRPEGYGVQLDTDPTGLISHYEPHEIAPAPPPETDRNRILQVVADWAYRCAEYGGEDSGDLIWDLKIAGYTLPDTTTDTKETDR